MTRGQLSRAERERQQIRNLYTVGFAVITLVVLILGFAVISTLVLQPNQTVASVQYQGQNKVDVNRATYNKLRRWNIWQEAQFNLQFSGSGAGASDPSTVIAQLRNVENEPPSDNQTISQLIDGEVLRQAAKADFQLDPTKEELTEFAKKEFIPEPTPPSTPAPSVSPTSEITGTSTITPTVTRTFTPGPPTQTPTRTPTLPPVPGGEKTAEARYKTTMENIDGPTSQGLPDISEDDYLTLIIEPQFLQEKVTDQLATSIITAPEQIHAQHILTTTQEGAQKIIQMLDQGADFTKLANEQSKEQLDNIAQGRSPNGGDLGWFPKEGSNFVKEFVEGAWPVQAGQYTKTPVQTTFGYHVIKVIEREANRALAESEVETAKTQKYQDWFTAAKQKSQISPAPTPTPVPATQPPIVNPPSTPVPGTPTPAGTGEAITGTGSLTDTGNLTGAAPGAGTPAGGSPLPTGSP
jgi:hypothetical protein